jgi:hypothetical protein
MKTAIVIIASTWDEDQSVAPIRHQPEASRSYPNKDAELKNEQSECEARTCSQTGIMATVSERVFRYYRKQENDNLYRV